MSKTLTNQDASNILSNVPQEKAFFFCTAEEFTQKFLQSAFRILQPNWAA